jgi:hypothetical protein
MAHGADRFGGLAFERGAEYRQVQVTVDPAELLAVSTLLVSTAPQSTAKSAMSHSDSSGRHWVVKSWWGEALTCHCLW